MGEEKEFSRADARKMAARLRKSDSWSVDRMRANREDPSASLQRMALESHSEKHYTETAECPECKKERRSTGDETALCEVQFESMMDF